MSFLFAPRMKAAPADDLVPYRARVFDERHERFAKLRNAHVLIYWPHGFGDFVHLGYLLPLLEPSNTYHIMRYGDDFSALYAYNAHFPMLASGIRTTTNAFGSSAVDYHLGVAQRGLRGAEETIYLKPQVAQAMHAARIDAVLWTDYPDPSGSVAYPFHTKIRALAQRLVPPERLTHFDLTQPLANAAMFDDDALADAIVAERLCAVFGNRDVSQLCVVLSGGHTAPKKNWDDANAQDFIKLFIDAAPKKRAVVRLNDPLISSGISPAESAVSTWNELFDDAAIHGVEYARIVTALLRRTALMVGVPAGPLHLALAMGSVPTVGLWRVHHPAAYEEPHARSRHIVAASVARVNRAQSRLYAKLPPGFAQHITDAKAEGISGALVHRLAEELL